VHLQIMLAVVLGFVCAIIAIRCNLPISFTIGYIKPIGTIFLNGLKMVAIPLVFSTLVICIVTIQDTAKISRMSLKAFVIYAVTTAVSVAIGIASTHLLKPGNLISNHTRAALVMLYHDPINKLVENNQHPLKDSGPLSALIKLVPENFLHPFTGNENFLQIVFLAIFLGIALLRIPPEKRKSVVAFFDGIYEAIIEAIKMIMKIAPFGVFSLTFSMFVELLTCQEGINIWEILGALLGYFATVVTGLSIVLCIVYPIILKMFTPMGILRFFKGIYPAQLLAFSSASSSVVLPVSADCLQNKLGVSKEVGKFVLPLGATLNMNGTALYQAVICLFVSQSMGIELTLTKQMFLIGHITLASLGVASAPGAALVVTMVLLQSVDIPTAGLALILPIDRILDMLRTVVNVTGDAVAAVVIAETEKNSKQGTM